MLSTLVIKPKLSDDSVPLSCVAKHEALPGKMSMFTTAQLNVHCKLNVEVDDEHYIGANDG